MSETQFSKADWRPSKKRVTYVRERAWGGQKQAPLAFLAAAKFAGLNTNCSLRCSRIAISTGRPCCRVAMKGTTLCLSHGGRRQEAPCLCSNDVGDARQDRARSWAERPRQINFAGDRPRAARAQE